MCFKPKSLSNLLIPDMYLIGVFIDCDAHDYDDIMHQVNGIYARGNILISRLRFAMMM